ncbi:RagB/SusD family nutrient uptake outer membrane protein [Salegentibacter maritimus]|uniref:RagB/SusD family nutrient uptake outer membrane protein n=1 Tax=Salegentibacter maritimus TaxID=2794347 RepID=A0ABS0TMJ9_9FLAO|nr:RagB/SusD family nutrient uptake outer membrane protein [Salegentibacter maritimus]MBI6121233.1 RagB/SusD family nutrient uptake outer membrane protein [Salegentibacter maritimus]
MKLVNRTYIFAFGFSILMLGSSCSDFLEEKNESNYTQDNYFQTAAQAETVINELYAELRFVLDNVGTYGEGPFMMLEFPTGLLNTEVGQAEFNRNLRTLNANAENNYFNVWWEQSFEAIANANLAISNIPGIDMNDANKKKLIAQAKFMRAFHYFNLVRIFGDVPLILEPVDATSELLYPERTPKAEVYNAIVSDLIDAEAAGLSFKDTTGKVSTGAIKSLLSSVYLTMAGYPLQAGDEYYKMSADKAKEVIENSSYNLFNDYDELHDPETQNSGEFIFQNNYLAGANLTNYLTQWLLPRALNISKFSDEFGVMYPTEAFISSHEPGDKRIEEKEFYFTEYPSIDDQDQIVNFNAHYIYKYFDENAVLETAQSDLNWTFFRYAEVLLTYAEAGYEAYGPTTDVLEAINKVRRRAQLPEFDSNITKEDIWRERFHELAFENKYWFDMVRRRKVLNVESGNWDDFIGHQFTYGPSLTEKYLLFGIPQREIDNNKKLTQNPGW